MSPYFPLFSTYHLRGGVVSPVDQRLEVMVALASEKAVCTWHLAQISVADLVECAGLDDCNGTSVLLYQSRGNREASVAATNDKVVICHVVSRDSKRRTKKCPLDVRGQRRSQGGFEALVKHVGQESEGKDM